MTAAYKVWPYDEVKLTVGESGNEVHIETPWIKIDADIEKEDAHLVESIIKKIGKSEITALEVSHISSFFSNFLGYPIYYILPEGKKGDQFKVKNDKLINKTVEESILEIAASSESLGGIRKENIDEIMKHIIRDKFIWDDEGAIQFSNINGFSHPESILTVARRYHMIDVMDNNNVSTIYSSVKNLEKDDQRTLAATFVRQNHYVTKNCGKALAPALESSGSSKAKVEEFIREEKDHDILMESSLKTMGFSPSDLEVSLMIKCLVDTLTVAAERNFLGFAILIDFFERSSYSKTDPLADMLVESGFKKAAYLINRHKIINDQGGHDLFSFDLLKLVGLCSEDYVKEALTLAELGSIFMHSLMEEVYAPYREKYS